MAIFKRPSTRAPIGDYADWEDVENLQEIISQLQKEIEQLKISNMGDEYDEAEAERFRSEYERQICEAFYKWLYDSEEFSNFDKEYELFKSKEGGK